MLGVYWDNGKMETTIMGYIGLRVQVLEFRVRGLRVGV